MRNARKEILRRMSDTELAALVAAWVKKRRSKKREGGFIL